MRRFSTRRSLTAGPSGSAVIPPSPPPDPFLDYVAPTGSTDALQVVGSLSGSVTAWEVWTSTDGVSYSLGTGGAGVAGPGPVTGNTSLLTRNQQTWVKIRSFGPGGYSGFSNAHYAWPVDVKAYNYVNWMTSDFGTASFEMVEYNYVDYFWQNIVNAGLDSDATSLMLFSPSAGFNIFLYDLIGDSVVASQTGGTYDSSGAIFNFDGYIDMGYPAYRNIASPPFIGFVGLVPNADTYPASPTDFQTICGATDGSDISDFGTYNSGGSFDLYAINGSSTAQSAIADISFGLSTYSGFGAGTAFSGSNVFVAEDVPITNTNGFVPAGTNPKTPNFYIGARNNNGSADQYNSFTIFAFGTGTWTSFTQLEDLYSAFINFNSNFSRP